MSTRIETTEFIVDKLGNPGKFSVRAMFGEYALYCTKKATANGAPPQAVVVGLICDDQLYVKILPESAELENICDKDEAYPGSKKFYVVEEGMLSTLRHLPEILLDIAKALPVPKKKVKK